MGSRSGKLHFCRVSSCPSCSLSPACSDACLEGIPVLHPDPPHAHHPAAKPAGLITLRAVTVLQNPGIDPFLSPFLGSSSSPPSRPSPPGAEDRRKLLQAHREHGLGKISAAQARIGSAGADMPCRQSRAVGLATQVARIRVPNLVMGHAHTSARSAFGTGAELDGLGSICTAVIRTGRCG